MLVIVDIKLSVDTNIYLISQFSLQKGAFDRILWHLHSTSNCQVDSRFLSFSTSFRKIAYEKLKKLLKQNGYPERFLNYSIKTLLSW